MANRCSGFGGNKGGRWGYGSFKGRENNGPRAHHRFGANTNGMNHKSNGISKPNGFSKSNGYSNGNGIRLYTTC